MTPLPTVAPADHCRPCGSCCATIGTPPSLWLAFMSPEWDGTFCGDAEDHAIWLAMPESLRRELTEFYAGQDALPGHLWRSESGLPCLWYDTEAKRCRHYEHRPQACRDFEPGEEACNEWRHRVGLEPLPSPPEESAHA